MKPDLKTAYTSIIDEMFAQPLIKPEEIPNIAVYMDQLTTFMDERLRVFTRDPAHDKVLTKTMINNYTKNNLMPPPHKKKYSPDHLILLIYIFYLKRNFSIEDIGRFIAPMKHLMENKTGLPSLREIYSESIRRSGEEKDAIRAEMDRLFEKANATFPDADESHKAELHMFSFLELLALEVHIRQVIIEKLLDLYREDA